MSALKNILSDKQFVLERVQGLDLDNEPIYAYLLLKENKLAEFRAALASEDVDLAEYGVIIASGSGTEIPEGLDEQVIASIKKLDS